MNKKEFKIPDKPYKFLDYYDIDDTDIFFGRDREIQILLSDIISTRLVVLFAKTGSGKTSLINAGVRPELEKLDYATFYVRVEKDPTKSVIEKFDNAKLISSNYKKKPLATQLVHAAQKLKKPIVIFFDQFEEFFIYIVNENPEKAHQFISNIAEIYSNPESGIHIVFSMREEYFVEMDLFREDIPSIFHYDSNLRLRWFDKNQARDAIVKPLKPFGIHIEDSLVTKLLSDISDNERIEPARLQIVCDALWNNRANDKILFSVYEKLGTAENILNKRLENDIDFILNDKQLGDFERLLPELSTEKGTKYIRGFDELVKNLKIESNDLHDLVDHLKNLRLIRESTRYGALYLEWTSDYLVEHKVNIMDIVKTISIKRKLKFAISKVERKTDDLSIPKILQLSSIEDYKEDDPFIPQPDFEVISEGSILLNDLSQIEIKFMFIAALIYGTYMNTWFVKATKSGVDVWQIIKDRLSYNKIQNVQVKNTIYLLAELRDEQAMELLKAALLNEDLALIIIDVLGKMKTQDALFLLDKALEQTVLYYKILTVLRQMRQQGDFARKANSDLKNIAMLLPDDIDKGLINPNKNALENILAKYANNLFHSSLEYGIDMLYWYNKASDKKVDVWKILREIILTKDTSLQKAENVIKLLGMIDNKKALELLNISLNQPNLFRATYEILSKIESLEVVKIWDEILQKEIFISQAKTSLEYIINSETAKSNVKHRAKIVLSKWEKGQKIVTLQPKDIPSVIKEPPFKQRYGIADEIWAVIIRMIKTGNCTPFLGGGVNSHLLPLGSEVSRLLAQKYNYPLADKGNLSRVSQYIAITRDPTILKYGIVEILKEKGKFYFSANDEIYRILAELPFPIYLTTNYDDFLLKALKRAGRNPIFDFCRWNYFLEKTIPTKIMAEAEFDASHQNPMIYHLQGSWDVPQSLVITEDDYIEFLINITHNITKKIPSKILLSLSRDMLIFMGYNLQDTSFRSLYQGFLKAIDRGLQHKNICVLLAPKDEHAISIKKNIHSLEDFFNGLSLPKETEPVIEDSISRLKHLISYYSFNKKDIDLFYKQSIVLEDLIFKASLDNNLKERFISIINSLQENIGLLSTEVEQKNNMIIKYLENYCEELGINIFWGTPKEFLNELFERWKKF